MNNKHKKVLLLTFILTLLFALTGCDQQELNFDVNESIMQDYTQKIISQYNECSENEQQYYLAEGNELQQSAVAGFMAAESTDHVGYFIDFASGEDSYTVSNGVDGKVNFSQICKYEHRDVEVTVSYKQNLAFEMDKEELYNDMSSQAAQYGMDVSSYVSQMYGSYPELDMTSMDHFLDSYLAAAYNEYPYIADECEVSAVYSKKELVGQAGKNTAIGMGVVFIVLIFISFIISLLKYLPLLFDADIRKSRNKKAQEHEEARKKTEDLIIGSSTTEDGKTSTVPSDDEDLMNDEELVAVITAAVYAASCGTVRGPAYTASNDRLVVRSIRRSNR